VPIKSQYFRNHGFAAQTNRSADEQNAASRRHVTCRDLAVQTRELEQTPSHHHSSTVRTTLEVGKLLTALPPSSFMIAASYSGSVATGAFALTCTILKPFALS
jgi:hypothetical protein